MDLIAYSNHQCNDLISNYIKKHYGDVPRIRGVRFMKLEDKATDKFRKDVTDIFGDEDEESVDYSKEIEMFNKYAGQDVIYIHTRCGDCDLGYDDKNSNYISCGAKKWEEEHKNLFLDHITDPFDCTYCTHYFKAIIDEDYKKIVKEGGK